MGLKMEDGSWMAKGSATVSSEHEMSSSRTIDPRDSFQFYEWRASMIFKRFTWICGDGKAASLGVVEMRKPL